MMDADTLLLLSLAIAAAAALYGSVGHGGASAYIALMALFGMAPDEIRPIALVLNILVAGLGAIRFIRAGRFSWDVFWPFAATAVPAAFFAARIPAPDAAFRALLALALAAAALRYLLWPQIDAIKPARAPSKLVALASGGVLGALAGLTGIGGGVFLSPLLVYAGWADPQRATGIAALFIVVNSAAGLAGRFSSLTLIPHYATWFALAAMAGALAGIALSLARFDKSTILRALGAVLAIAAAALALQT